MTRYDLSFSRDDVIDYALGMVILGDGETPTTEQRNVAALGLNMLIKTWSAYNIGYWSVINEVVTFTAGTKKTTAFSGDGVISLNVVKYLDGDTYTVIPVWEHTLFQKQDLDTTETGSPRFCSLHQNDLLFYPIADKNYTVSVDYIREEQEFDAGADTVTAPSRFYLAMVFGLAEILSHKYKRSPNERVLFKQRYDEELKIARGATVVYSNTDNFVKGY